MLPGKQSDREGADASYARVTRVHRSLLSGRYTHLSAQWLITSCNCIVPTSTKAAIWQVANRGRYLLQVGTSVVTRDKDQRLALGRLGALVESLEHLVRTGKQVILVTSGATAVGRQKLRFQQVLNSSPLEMQMLGLSSLQARAAAAAGQSGLMALYDSLFQMMDMQCSQFLVTSRDFKNDDFKKNLNLTVDNLLRMNVVPVINENDSISSTVRPPSCCHMLPLEALLATTCVRQSASLVSTWGPDTAVKV